MPTHLVNADVSPDIYSKMREALKSAAAAMGMQEYRQNGLYHIPAATASKIWNKAKSDIDEALKLSER